LAKEDERDRSYIPLVASFIGRIISQHTELTMELGMRYLNIMFHLNMMTHEVGELVVEASPNGHTDDCVEAIFRLTCDLRWVEP
jgi:hypothetical protein